MHNALCHGGGSVRNACFVSGRGGRVHKAFFGESPLSPRGGRCTMPCVTEGGAGAQRLVSPSRHCRGFLHSALCHRAGAALPTTPCVTRGALCTTPCVTARPGSQRLVSPGGPVRNALCHSGGGACACGLVARATNFFPASHGLKSQARPCAQRLVSLQGGRPCTTPCVTGGACAQRLVSSGGGPCAQRLMSPRGDLCTTRCVAQRLVSPRGGLT